MGVVEMSFLAKISKWWKDDWHIFPRVCRDIWYWLKGSQWTRVNLHIFTYDPVSHCNHDDVIRIPKKELPPEALHLSGRGYKEWLIDHDCSGPWPKKGEITAVDLYLFALTDAYNLEHIFKKRNGFGIDMGMLMWALLGIGAAVGVWLVFKWIL